jgi:uncharacterized glyoxalase superfamily protein PhnB
MVQNPPEGMPECCPNLFYDDVARAVAFLTKAFGFTERFIDREADGRIHHAQLQHGRAVVMLGQAKDPRAIRPCKSPKEAGSLNAGVYLFVEDVDRHHARAEQAGAEIIFKLSDMHWGDRLYCAVDPEGQFWTFATHVRDVAPKDM